MAGLITMDDLTNDEILQILDDAERLLPVAQGKLYLPTSTRAYSWKFVF